MKNIQVPDEMYDKFIELAKEYVSQDNRATRMPYLFQVQEQERVYFTDPYQGSNYILQGEEIIIESASDLIDYFTDLSIEEEKIIKEMWDNPFDSFAFREKELDIDEFISAYCPDLKEGSFDYKPTYKNAFFTAKGCKEHIEANKHNLHSPVDYLNYAERNPEMELISNFLCEIAKI